MSHLASPSALGRYVEDRLRRGLEPVLEAGWIVSLLAYGHKPERFPDFAEAALHAAIRVADSGAFPTVAAYLRHVHEAHALTMPKRVCGYMFQQNDISWSCRDCEMDETCVQCQACFEASDHDGHQVFFHRTSPGGMCDCGDTEAWQVHGMCPAHRVQASDADVVETPLELPPPLTATILDVLRELIVYMVDVAGRATNNHDPTKIEARLKPKKRKHTDDDDLPTLYHVRISNDDVHTDQDLTGSLVDKGYSLEFAEQFTHLVDADGAALLKEKVLLHEALALMQAMEAEGWLASVVDDDHLAREAIVVRLFSYIHGLAQLSPTLQQMLFGVLFEPLTSINDKVYTHVSSDMEPIVELLTATSVLPKAIVMALHSAYLHLMGDRTLKWQFALFYVEVYQLVMREYLCGVGTKNEAMFGLSVQIFTTPSIVPQLVDDKGLLSMLLHVLAEGLELTKVDDDDRRHGRVINLDHIVVRFTRYEPVITDLGFVLLVPSVAHAFLEHLPTWARLLYDASHLNAQLRVRESEPHIELEDNMPWYNALLLHVSLASVTESFFKGLRLGKHVLDIDVAALIWDGLWPALTAAPLPYHTIGQHRVVQCDVAAEPVSLHHPLHQAIGLFVLELLAVDTIDVIAFAHARVGHVDKWDVLFEFPLRSLVLSAQIASHLWVRNGQELMTHEVTSYADQAYYFPNLTAHVSFRDVDLTLLQFGVVILGPDAFLARFLDRYGLASYLASPTTPRLWSSEKQTQLVAQSLLHLLWLLTEVPPPASQGAEIGLRRKLVHLLLHQPCNYSTLRDEAASVYAYPQYDALPEDARNKQLRSVLDEIAESQLAATDSIAPAKYVLKHAVYHEYDPACLHLSGSRHIKAQEARHDVVFKNWRDTPVPLVAALPMPHAQMARVRDLALTPDLVAVLRHCLRDAQLGGDETMLTRTVHLLTLQLHVLNASSERDAATAALVPELTMAATPTDARLALPFPPGNHAPCGDGSLVQLLAAHATRLRALGEASLTPLLAGILYVLAAYAAMDEGMARFLAADVLRVVAPTTSSGPLDAKARLALQKQKQQQAMAAMLARQSQFATSLLDDDDDDEADTDRTNAMPMEQPPPECIICAHVKKDDPIMFIGLAQRIGRPQRSHDAAIHVQLCGHAVHLSCVEQYRCTMRRETDASMLSAVAFDAARGEFLCPLCKALSSTTVPFVPRPAPSTSGPAMEAFFQRASSVESVLAHLQQLPSRLRSSAPLAPLPPAARDAMHAYVTSLQRPLDSAAATVLDTVADAFAAAETQGLSAALLHIAYAPTATATHRLGVDLPPDADGCLDALTPRDDAKLEALRLVLQLLPSLLATDYVAAVPDALARTLEGDVPHAGALPALSAPLLAQDLFPSLLVACAIIQDKAEILWTIRSFAALQMAQALVQTTTACDAMTPDGAVTSVDGWRASLGGFETTVLTFLRKATLLARAIFRGPEDPDASLYLNFVSTLRGSSSLPRLCQQLGVPLPGDLFGATAFRSVLAPLLESAHVPALPIMIVGSVPWAWHVHSPPLPQKYTDLYALHSGHRCPSTSLSMETTALCLRCGVAVCAGTDCCKVDGQGACSRHVEHCGHGSGAFFLLKACSVLLVSMHGRACFFTSPYVDEYGEEDIYVKRGRPLHLRFKRLALLVQLLAGHGIAPEVSKVRRTSDQYIRTYYY
ncbi:hypothetical protein SPRG_07127 [Saprolegnia parasitica CBS 223.65]|uniref:E3 ubiquitin-protein ligase n=1 Tax=Saprolegnia parasitica (strain CBS 223.65) TaxID=695850 RepID=A0A067CAR2_SAPPC|nr:hypothetical protein SPRG_07127 [Saprolegnia parasitica CBS 223.65]KDO27854.1 hypothetical protein SPRG_07127 [Saprolegnia parasitica CBS 223.65]|eukprot:XP_012201314.1 hypothetical protein SPRG_07127 [Saprolegnia parasitica CBS 223.65]